MPKKIILTSERRAKHPFAGCNTQHILVDDVNMKPLNDLCMVSCSSIKFVFIDFKLVLRTLSSDLQIMFLSK